MKALKQSKKRALINLNAKKNIKSLTKKAIKAIEGKDLENVKKYSMLTVKEIDKAIQRGILKKNTGARKKSSLAKRVNSIASKS